jgi:hypothetical protein
MLYPQTKLKKISKKVSKPKTSLSSNSQPRSNLPFKPRVLNAAAEKVSKLVKKVEHDALQRHHSAFSQQLQCIQEIFSKIFIKFVHQK